MTRRTSSTGPVALKEAGSTGLQSTGDSAGRKFRACLIKGDILGSSGYYSRELLERDGPRVFAEGTHIYIDHPTETEQYDRPERSLRDLAGRIASTPVYESDGLYADVLVHPQWGDVIEAMRDDIGMSIRAAGTYEMGERDGQWVKVITALKMSESVDFVTKAGAGGKITRLIESAAIPHLAEATANDTRQALQSALTDRFGGEKTWLWVRDFDDTTVWFELESPDGDDILGIGYSLNDSGAAVLATDEPVEVTPRTTYVPVSSAGGSTTTTEALTEGDMAEVKIDEAEHRRLTTLAEAAATEKTRADKAELALAESRAKNAQTDARADAETRAKKLVESVEVREATKTRIVESVLAGLPMIDGKLDVPAFEARVTERATGEAAYEAALLKEAGVGTVTGEGGTSRTTVTESQQEREIRESIDQDLVEEFKLMGLSESQAKAAAAGRG